MSNLSQKALRNCRVAIPPLAEQHRIVAKVDELMALCDELEERQQRREKVRGKVNAAALDRLLNATDAADFATHWRRICDHFDILYEDPDNVAELRKAILQLAVQGKLVPQDPNDEPAVDSLDAPVEIAGRKRKPPKWSGPVTDAERPFALPPGWIWQRLGDVAVLKHGYAFSSDFFRSEPAPYVLTTPGNFFERGGFRDRESKRKYYDGPVKPEFILQPGDLLIPMTEQAAGLLGSPAFVPGDGRVYLHNQRLGRVTFHPKNVLPAFAFWFFNCSFFRDELARTSTGMKVRHTSPDRVLQVPFPLPPLAEQHRIVAKVDELMALCDELEKGLREGLVKRERLAAAMAGAVG